VTLVEPTRHVCETLASVHRFERDQPGHRPSAAGDEHMGSPVGHASEQLRQTREWKHCPDRRDRFRAPRSVRAGCTARTAAGETEAARTRPLCRHHGRHPDPGWPPSRREMPDEPRPAPAAPHSAGLSVQQRSREDTITSGAVGEGGPVCLVCHSTGRPRGTRYNIHAIVGPRIGPNFNQ
jgi:hypothetical protein